MAHTTGYNQTLHMIDNNRNKRSKGYIQPLKIIIVDNFLWQVPLNEPDMVPDAGYRSEQTCCPQSRSWYLVLFNFLFYIGV